MVEEHHCLLQHHIHKRKFGSGSLIINLCDMANSGVLVGITAHTLSVVFEDGFNDHVTNYNSARTKTVYSVDSYDSNSQKAMFSF